MIALGGLRTCRGSLRLGQPQSFQGGKVLREGANGQQMFEVSDNQEVRNVKDFSHLSLDVGWEGIPVSVMIPKMNMMSRGMHRGRLGHGNMIFTLVGGAVPVGLENPLARAWLKPQKGMVDAMSGRKR